ncbi:12551_t:CDS:2 [Entrophospora sp. SA101]|nr:3556_t:CDS:2 [Entrophospora sp. SA101]CAJ0752225.1 12551_t:CDS:2 [Entrophospora sp. SA101]CAJ0824866.1 15584_t:CDS:2 [Entrophospora sp. SA101]CAJ0846898.1 9689_t:CDS:2 [Entrophospora sp. SA101]
MILKNLKTFYKNLTSISNDDSINNLAIFFKENKGKLSILSGAGISTASGIPDYRGINGVYKTNKSYKSILYNEFVSHHHIRQRYWARSFFGWKNIYSAKPNETHFAIKELQSLGYIQDVITQNVDGLLQAAGTQNVLELHGTLHEVHCLKCGFKKRRPDYQEILMNLNPKWVEFSKILEMSKANPKTNPDGDIELPSNITYENFNYPSCEQCESGLYKPSVVFFGENIRPEVRKKSTEIILRNKILMVVGSTLTTYSAYRLVFLAKELGSHVIILNLGKTRGDALARLKIERSSEEILSVLTNRLNIQQNL